MGLEFGNLCKLTGITYFRLSPYEQKAFAGSFDLAGRMLTVFRQRFLRIAPMFLLTYMLQSWATEENAKSHRKNPKDYQNDT